MFRSIKTSLERVQKTIRTRQAVNETAHRVVSGYIADVFGAGATPLLVVITFYDEEKKQLSIETKSKTLASELLLRSGEIAALLRSAGVNLRRLCIR